MEMRVMRQLWTSLKMSFIYIKILPQLLVGSWKVARLPQPVVSVFGGSRLKKDCQSTRQAEELARRLVEYEISVITGGGPGIMEAANCGAFKRDDHKVHTMGIGVKGVTFEDRLSPCVKDHVILDYFALRKHLLIHYSYAYVIFPGGFGTLDEFAEVMTLMQTKKLSIVPVILIGKEYWHHFNQWVARAVQEGLIPQEHADYFITTDDIDQALDILVNHCKKCLSKK